jgi:hypothetical protein
LLRGIGKVARKILSGRVRVSRRSRRMTNDQAPMTNDL